VLVDALAPPEVLAGLRHQLRRQVFPGRRRLIQRPDLLGLWIEDVHAATDGDFELLAGELQWVRRRYDLAREGADRLVDLLLRNLDGWPGTRGGRSHLSIDRAEAHCVPPRRAPDRGERQHQQRQDGNAMGGGPRLEHGSTPGGR
jgi:hypothetical protein